MMIKVNVALLIMAVFASAFKHAQTQAIPESALPSYAEIWQILIDRIDV